MMFLYLRVFIFQTVALVIVDTSLPTRFLEVRRGSTSDGLAKRFLAIVLLQQSKQFVFRLSKV